MAAKTPIPEITFIGSDSRLASRVGRPFRRFLEVEAAGGIVLLLATAVALIWANSPWSDSYSDLWHTEFEVVIGDFHLGESHGHLNLELLVNDALMVVFFFVVGLEIKRELVTGQLRDPRAAARELTDRVAAGLHQVTLRLERWEDLPLLELAAEIANPDDDARLTTLHEFAESASRLRAGGDPALVARLDALRDRVAAFRSRLASLGLRADAIHARYSTSGVVRFALRNLATLCVLLPLATLGALFWVLPYRAIPLVARLAKPTRDVHATVQMLAGILLFPLHLALVGWALLLWLGTGWTSVVLLLSIPLGLLALAYRDWRAEVWADVRAFLRLGARRRLRELLVRERAEIAGEIAALRADLATG